MNCCSGILLGAITIARSASTDGFVSAWVREYRAAHPEVEIRQTAQATDLPAHALDELLDGSVDLAPFVREIQPAEAEAARRRLGYAPLGLAIASGSYATPSNTHAIAFFVNTANPIRHLTLAQLDGIYSSTRLRGAPDAVTRWGQLGLTGDWADRPIHPYGMVIERKTGNPHAGIVAYLMERLMLGGAFKPSILQVPDTGMGRGNNHALDEIAAAVAHDPDAIGYAGFANQISGVRPVPLAEAAGGPYYAGTQEEVAARVYPLTRTIFLYARKPLSTELRAFLEYALSPAGQAQIGKDPAGFLPLPPAMLAAQRATVEAKASSLP